MMNGHAERALSINRRHLSIGQVLAGDERPTP
jgi:hypothetical protein